MSSSLHVGQTAWEPVTRVQTWLRSGCHGCLCDAQWCSQGKGVFLQRFPLQACWHNLSHNNIEPYLTVALCTFWFMTSPACSDRDLTSHGRTVRGTKFPCSLYSVLHRMLGGVMAWHSEGRNKPQTDFAQACMRNFHQLMNTQKSFVYEAADTCTYQVFR